MDNLREEVRRMLDAIQQDLYEAAKKRMEERIYTVDSYDEYKARVEGGGFFRVFLDHANPLVEETLQADTRSTIRCIPLESSEETGPCMITGKPCKGRVIAAQSY